MKNIFFLAMCGLFVSTQAQDTYVFIEEQNPYTKGGDPSGTLLANTTHYFNDRIGVYVFGLLTTTQYGELYAGPVFPLLSKRGHYGEVGVAIGVETTDPSVRGAAYFFYEYQKEKGDSIQTMKGKTTFLLNAEYGGSGWWYLGYINYNITNVLGVGGHAQWGATWGPRIQINIPKGFRLWGTGGWNMEVGKPSVLGGVRLSF